MVDSDFFGFLNRNLTIEFDGGIISPVEHFESYAGYVEKYTNEDGFCYPPLENRVRVDPTTKKTIEEIPKTERPALLHKLPPSHEIRLYDSPKTIKEFREGPGGFIVHLLAYLFGTRLQFHNWWFDSRIPINESAKTHNIYVNGVTVSHFLSHSYKKWKCWDDNNKKLFINIIFMHSRSPSYEWPWERFVIEYMVLDGCYKLATENHNVKHSNHIGRFKALCETFGIPYAEDIVDKIIRLRNQLFHETLWDNSYPFGGGSNFAYLAPDHLRRFNQRLISALLDYKNHYVNTGWWYLGSCIFDQP